MNGRKAKMLRNQGNGPKPVQIKVNMDELDDIACVCGNQTFIDAKRIKKISAIMSPNGQAGYVNFPVAICSKCFEPLPPKA